MKMSTTWFEGGVENTFSAIENCSGTILASARICLTHEEGSFDAALALVRICLTQEVEGTKTMLKPQESP